MCECVCVCVCACVRACVCACVCVVTLVHYFSVCTSYNDYINYYDSHYNVVYSYFCHMIVI